MNYDFRNDFKVGDIVLHLCRASSSMWADPAVVLEVHEDHVMIKKDCLDKPSKIRANLYNITELLKV